MKINMGSTDRIIRLVLAIAFATLYFAGSVSGIWGIVIMVVAGVFLLTGIIGTCPLYSLFGFSSCPTEKAEKK